MAIYSHWRSLINIKNLKGVYWILNNNDKCHRNKKACWIALIENKIHCINSAWILMCCIFMACIFRVWKCGCIFKLWIFNRLIQWYQKTRFSIQLIDDANYIQAERRQTQYLNTSYATCKTSHYAFSHKEKSLTWFITSNNNNKSDHKW